MNVATLKMPRAVARREFQKYREVCRGFKGTERDETLLKMYRQLSLGRQIISASQAIGAAGNNSIGQPVLAICRADSISVWFIPNAFKKSSDDGWTHTANLFLSDYRKGPWIKPPPRHKDESDSAFAVIWNTLQTSLTTPIAAQVPIIPPDIRPPRELRNYHILFEADWRAPPKDPILLKRISKDHFVVLASWDLTEAERMVLGSAKNLS